METKDSHSKHPKVVKKPTFKRKFLSFSFALAVIALLAFLGTHQFLQMNLNKEIALTKISNENLEKKLSSLVGNNSSKFFLERYEKIREIMKKRIQWSIIMKKILQYESTNVRFTEFSSDRDFRISINGTITNYPEVSQFLKFLKQDSNIIDPFISSISVNEKNSDYNFQISFLLKQ